MLLNIKAIFNKIKNMNIRLYLDIHSIDILKVIVKH